MAQCRRCLTRIGEVQTTDVPGRHEPGTGEVNWHGIAKALAKMRYTGPIGTEAPLRMIPEWRWRRSRSSWSKSTVSAHGKVRAA